MSIYKTAVTRPITTIMIFVAIMVLGLYSLVNLPIDFYPEMDLPAISVYTTYPGASAEDVENNVTKNIEKGMNSVDDLKEITSVSKDNYSIVTLEFEWGADLAEAANDIRDNLSMVSSSLPDDANEPLIFKFNSSSMPVMFFAVTAKESYPGLVKLIEDKVVNPLQRIEGIASVSITGHPGRAIYVDTDPSKLEAYNITLEQIGNAIAAQNIDLPLGSLEMGQFNFPLRVAGKFTESSQIAEIAIGNNNGKTIFLKDVAVVKDTIRDVKLYNRVNGEIGANFFIQKQSGANTVKLSQEVHKKIAEIKEELPEDVKIELTSDNSTFIQDSIDNLKETVFYAMLFVVIVVFLFLGRWRSTLIIALTIPISLVVAFIYLRITGGTLNIISLMSISIALGMVVDDAIVVLENITTHIERGNRPREAAIYATNEVWLSVIVTTLTVVAIFLPLTFTSGMMGVMFKQLGWIVCITIVTSTITAITLTPTLSALFLKLQDKTKKKKFFLHYDNTILPVLNALDRVYAKSLRWSLHHKKIVIPVLFAVFVASILLIGKVGFEFMPATDQSNLTISIELQSGTKAAESYKMSQRIDSLLRTDYPEMKIVSFSTGVDDQGSMSDLFQQTGYHIINFRCRLVPVEERTKSVFDISEEVREKLASFTEIVNYEVGTQGMSMGSSQGVAVEIYGHDFDETTTLAKQLAEKFKAIPGAEEVNISRDREKPELQVNFDQDKLSRHGLSTAIVATQLRNRINGYSPTQYRESGDEYDIFLRFDEKYRDEISEVENIGFTTPSGKIVRLKEIGDVNEYWSTPNIERKGLNRLVTISVIPGTSVSLGDLAQNIQTEVDKLELPQSVSITVGGEYEDLMETFGTLGLLLALGVLLVYIVMASQFESLKMPFIIMMSIPFAFTGVFISLYITNTYLSVIAALGAVMLVGIVVKNAIVLVDYINLMRERGVELYEAIVMSGESRLRPILMTALTTILGMLPMALSSGPGSEMWKGMGIAVVGGLTVSTFITLIIVPVIYALFARRGERDKKKSVQKAYKFYDA